MNKHTKIILSVIVILATGVSTIYSQFSNTIWTDPETITNAAPEDHLRTAIDPNGNVWAVWGDTSNQVKSSRYDATTQTWDAVETVALASITNPDPVVAVDANGIPIAIWQNGTTISVNRNTGNGWIELSNLSFNGFTPDIAMDNPGNAIAVWNTTGNVLGASRYNVANGTWTNIPLTTAGSSTLFPKVAMNGSGIATAVWLEDTTSVRMARYEGGSWVAQKSYAVTNGRVPEVAMDPNGNAIAVWVNNDQVQAARYRSGTGWDTTPRNLSAVSGANLPKVALDSSGNALAVWTIVEGTINRIQASRYNVATNSWTPIANVPFLSYAEDDTDLPEIAVDAAGNGVAIWYRVDRAANIDQIIQAARYDVLTGEWQEAQDVSVVGQNAISPQVAMNNNSDVTVAWAYFSTLPSPAQATHLIPDPTRVWANAIPSNGIQFSSGSSGAGVVNVGVVVQQVVRQGTTGEAVLLVHQPEDLIDVWATTTVSLADQNVTQVNVNVNVANNVVVGYVNNVVVVRKDKNNITKQVDTGEAWVDIGSGPEMISTSTEDARNIQVAVSNNVNVVNVVGVYVNNVVVVTRDKKRSPFNLDGMSDLSDLNVSGVFRQNNDDFSGDVVGSLYDVGTGMWVNTILSTGTAQAPRVAMDGTGNSFVVWQSLEETGTSKIQAARSDIGSWILPAKDLSDLEAEKPIVDSGTFSSFFAWRRWDGSNWRIEAVRYDGFTNWTSDWVTTNRQFLSPAGTDADNPSINVDSGGNAIAAWNIWDGANWRVQAARYDALTGQWALPEQVYISPEGIDTESPTVDAGHTGFVVVSYNVVNVAARNKKSKNEKQYKQIPDTQQTGVNIFDQNTLTFSDFVPVGIPEGILQNPQGVVNFNNQVAVVNVVNQVVVRNKNGFKQPVDESLVAVALLGQSQTPQTPQNVQTKQECHRFARQLDLINVLTWESSDSSIVKFEIYTDSSRTNLIGTVQANEALCFEQHRINPCIDSTYYIYSVNGAGVYSSPAVVTVPRTR